jgi:hypothetical protein
MLGKDSFRLKIEALYAGRRALAPHPEQPDGLWELNRRLFGLYFRGDLANAAFMRSPGALRTHLQGLDSVSWLMSRDSWSEPARKAIEPETGRNSTFGEETLPAHILANMGFYPRAVLESLAGVHIGLIPGVQRTAIEACCIAGGALRALDLSPEVLFRGCRRSANNLLAACNYHHRTWFHSEEEAGDPWEFLHWKERALLGHPCGVGGGPSPEGPLLRRLLSRPEELQMTMTFEEYPEGSVRVADYLSDHIFDVGMPESSLDMVRCCRESWGVLVRCPEIGVSEASQGPALLSRHSIPLPLSILISYYHEWLDRSHEAVDPIFFGALEAWGNGNPWEGYRAYFELPQVVQDYFERMGFAARDLRANYARLSATRALRPSSAGNGQEEEPAL